MQYQKNIRQNVTATKKQKRDIIWCNPAYSAIVVTNVGKPFHSLLDKYSPPHNKFHKIFYRNTLKICYSCIPSMKTTISSHSHKVTNPKTPLKRESATK